MFDVVYKTDIEVDYSLPLESFAPSFGTFDKNVTSVNFAPYKNGLTKLTALICKFKQPLATSNVLQYMKQQGIEQPAAHDLIAVGLNRSQKLHKILKQGRLICLCQPHEFGRAKLFVPIIWQITNRHVVIDRSNDRRWAVDELILGIKYKKVKK